MNHFTNGHDVQSGSILLTDFEKVISSKLVSVLPEDTCLINTTWFSNKETLSKLKQWECDKSRGISCIPVWIGKTLHALMLAKKHMIM